MSAEHPFGVRIPPDKGDANYEGCEVCNGRSAVLCDCCGDDPRYGGY